MDNSQKIILDLCGGTGAWSKPYKDNGYDVRLITLPDHDVRLYEPPDNVYGILAAPPCTMFSVARTVGKKHRDLAEGMEVVESCLNIIWKCQYKITSDHQRKPPLKFWALENPKGMLEWFLGKPTYFFQPYQFGNPYSKKTCLFCNPIPPGQTMKHIFNPVDMKRDFAKISELRSITPSGFANAFYEANR